MKRRDLAALVSRVALAALALAPRSAGANPVDLFGFDARGAAMANAQTAAARGATANYYNPAMLVLSDAIELGLGYQMARPRLSINGEILDVATSRGTTIALSMPGQIAGLPIAVGAGFYLPDQQLVRTRVLTAGQPRFQLFDNAPHRLVLALNLAARVHPDLAIGGGVSYMSGLEGDIVLRGRVGFPDAYDSDLGVAIDVDAKPVRYYQLGAHWQARPWLAIAFVGRTEFVLRLDQGFEIQGDVGPEGVEPVVDDGFFRLRALAEDLFQPRQVNVGVRLSPTEDLLWATDVAWQNWSRFSDPASEISLDFDIGDLNTLVDIPEPAPRSAPRFRDIVVLRTGVEWTWHHGPGWQSAVRGGYGLAPSPAPEQTGTHNFVDSTKHTVSVGWGFDIERLLEVIPRATSFDLVVSATRLVGRTHHKISPADPVGDYQASGWIWQIGVFSQWRL